MYTPEKITSLSANEVFVFGSNWHGNHGGGAAKTAKEKFGAESGIGEGLTGQCYAFPTMDRYMQPSPLIDLIRSRDQLFATARALPDKVFLLTKVGCGIAGMKENEVKQLFMDTPDNIVKPRGW